jgi:hypothetical protein
MALRVRSRIIARSSSANTAAICAMALPYGLVMSKFSAMATNWMPLLSKSSITLAASATDRNRRSNLATTTTAAGPRGGSRRPTTNGFDQVVRAGEDPGATGINARGDVVGVADSHGRNWPHSADSDGSSNPFSFI